MGRRTLLLRSTLVVAALAGAACDGDRSSPAPFEPPARDALAPGDFDPKAPPGWRLAIGDSISWPDYMAMKDLFPKWEGNGVVNEIDGVYYRADFENVAGSGYPTAGTRHDIWVFVGMERALSREERRALLPPPTRRKRPVKPAMAQVRVPEDCTGWMTERIGISTADAQEACDELRELVARAIEEAKR